MFIKILIESEVVTVTYRSDKSKHAGLRLDKKVFLSFVRNPREFDYVQRVLINSRADKYEIVEDNVTKTFSDPSENHTISNLVTYHRDLESRIRGWIRAHKPFFVEESVRIAKQEKPPAPTLMWATPRARVILGIDKVIRPLDLIGLMHVCPIVDRTGTVEFISPHLKTDHPLPDFSVPENRRIMELMLERAEELWRWAEDEGKQLVIWWSGGIDSTAVVIAMLRTSTPQRIKDLLRVGFNQRSIDEYPLFYKKYVKNLPNQYVSHNNGSEIDMTKLHVSGEIGDQLFGSDFLRACFVGGGRDFPGKQAFFGNLRNSWKDPMRQFVSENLTHRNLPADYEPVIMDAYEQLSAAAPIEITSLFDFWWWSNFNLKYTHVSNRIQMGSPDAVWAVQNVKAFFDTDTFQRWSVSNHDKKIKDTWKSYKFPLKNFIGVFTGDEDYRKNAVKVQSLKMHHDPRWVICDSDYIRYGRIDREALKEAYFGGDSGSDD